MLGSGYCIEIKGCNLLNSEAERFASMFTKLLDDYHILVFRNQCLSQSDLIKVSSMFGDLEITWDKKDRSQENEHVHMISNIGLKNYDYKSSAQIWHTDNSFLSRPSKYTILHSKIRPAIGGDTMFSDMRAAYNSLSDSVKNKIAGLKAIHSFGHQFKELRNNKYEDNLDEFFPEVVHPIVRIHPHNNKKSLYLNQLTIKEIIGDDIHENRSLLTQLNDHSVQEKFIYTHKWLEGDLLIWDNASLIHRGTHTPIELQRLLYRTSIIGDVTY
ncbi:MAG: TauD/TfdA family dioxygenase [Gammaproteobacteria bacterium]|nr:TauD/TfdA family dioxygenase [Gammaproteobacteria bacterium]